VDQVCGKDSDAWLLQEIGLCWPKVDETGRWAESGVRSNSNLQYNSTELDKSKAIQAGGVAVITTNDLMPRSVSRGGDPTGLGRWAWTRIEGSDNTHTRLVSVYRPCEPSSPGPGTVYEQHRRFYGDQDIDPREAVLDDLREDILAWQEEGDIIILGMDANCDTRSRKLKEYFEELNMKNSILDRHKHLSPPATHARNQQRVPIDGIWIIKGIEPIACGFLALGSGCPSNHVALWIDFRTTDLLGSKMAPLVFNVNKLKADDPRLVTTYNQRSKKALAKHNIKQRLTVLRNISKSQWSKANEAEYNAVQRINTERCGKLSWISYTKSALEVNPGRPSYSGSTTRSS
jgi:hypothetical protein